MKNMNQRIGLEIMWIIIGALLLALSAAEIVDRSFFSGMGGGLIAIGVLQLLRSIKYKKDAAYRAEYDTAVNDERNKFISTKAWAWAGYSFVMLVSTAVIVSAVLGLQLYVKLGTMCICLLCLMYWISYIILKRKY